MARNGKASSTTSDGLERLLVAIGEEYFDPLQRGALAIELKQIAAGYANRAMGPGLAPAKARSLIKKLRANTAERLKIRKQLRPIRRNVLFAAYLRAHPDADEAHLRLILADHKLPGDFDYAKIQADEDQQYQDYIDGESDYRKRAVGKYLVEPFLSFLKRHHVKPSRKRPLNRMVQALFDWIDLEKNLRLSPVTIRTIKARFERNP